jgi:hypothetical protein
MFQPEVAGRAIRFVAEHPRRNMWVGLPAAYTVLGNRVAPALLDWYLGRTGVNGQLTDKHGPRHGSNVFEPQDETSDRGAHGMFDESSFSRDPLSAISMRAWRLVERVRLAGRTSGRIRR